MDQLETMPVPEAPELFRIFEKDLIAERRNATDAAGNPYDPESLITGSEVEAGLTYHDKRHWPDKATYHNAVAGLMSPEEVARVAPRVKGNREVTFGE